MDSNVDTVTTSEAKSGSASNLSAKLRHLPTWALPVQQYIYREAIFGISMNITKKYAKAALKADAWRSKHKLVNPIKHLLN